MKQHRKIRNSVGRFIQIPDLEKVEEILEGNGVVVVLTSDTEDLASEDRASANALLRRRRSGGGSTTVGGDRGRRRSGRGGNGDRTQNGEKLDGDIDRLRALLGDHLNSTDVGEVASRGESGEVQLVLVGGLTSGKGDVTEAHGGSAARVNLEGNDGGQIGEDSGTESEVVINSEILTTETIGLEGEGSISSVPLNGGVTLSTIRGSTLEVTVGNTSSHEQVRGTRNDNQLKITFVTDDGTIGGGGESSSSDGVRSIILSSDNDLAGDGGELINDDGISEASGLGVGVSHEKGKEKKGRSHQRQRRKIKKRLQTASSCFYLLLEL